MLPGIRIRSVSPLTQKWHHLFGPSPLRNQVTVRRGKALDAFAHGHVIAHLIQFLPVRGSFLVFSREGGVLCC
jgi:hypothetical protein